MRAREFINEARGSGKLRKSHKKRMGGAVVKMRDVGGFDRIYHLNRIMMATAMADGNSSKPVDMDASSWYEKYNTAFPYTDAEFNMLQQAMNTIPTDKEVVVRPHKSAETDGVHAVSPVPSRDKLRK